jgi:hypothetical protein
MFGGIMLWLVVFLWLCERAAHYLHLSNPSYRAMLRAEEAERQARRDRQKALRGNPHWPRFAEYEEGTPGGWYAMRHRTFLPDKKLAGPFRSHAQAWDAVELSS